MQTCQWCHEGVKGGGGGDLETGEELRSDEAFNETLGNTCGVLVILESVFTYTQLLTKHPIFDVAVRLCCCCTITCYSQQSGTQLTRILFES